MKKIILITGSAGFIGFHLASKYLKKRYIVIGLDNFCKTYNPKLKKLRISILKKNKNFIFYKADLDKINIIKEKNIDFIIHLAAQAGVRTSLEKPKFYIKENIEKTISVFEFAKKRGIKKIFYASSSSVYGESNIYPSHENININKPLSIYGITKSCNEDIAYYYNAIEKISSIGFRFFTVYGPYGRPDMSINIFFKAIMNGQIVNLFNEGNNFRDYTYVGDIISQIYICTKIAKNNFCKIFNIGGEKTIKIIDLIRMIEKIVNKKSKIRFLPKNYLDPVKSLADNKKIEKFTKYKVNTSIFEGLKKTYLWLKKNKSYR
jgi:UDP-glucuronate 4-epimerase